MAGVESSSPHSPQVKGERIVLAGWPGMAKTPMALDIASKVAFEQGNNVLDCSLEMTKQELFGRLLFKECGKNEGGKSG